MKHAISLFDHSGVMLEPWNEAGYRCWAIDIKHKEGVSERDDGIMLVGADLMTNLESNSDYNYMLEVIKNRISFVSAFPPCTDLAVSGARWFKGKGLRALADSVHMFATATEFCEWSEAPYCIENPVSTISTYWRKPDHSFHPYEFCGIDPEDNYTKKTCLWVGNGFVMPTPNVDKSLGDPDNRIHWMPPSPERASLRSQTPRGFARAVYEANKGEVSND